VATFIPKLIGFLLVLVIGYVIVKAISKLASAALERVGFDKAVERGGIKQALASSKYDASDIVGKIIFYALFLFVLQLAFGTFGTNPVSDLIEGVIAYLPKLFAAIVIIVLAAPSPLRCASSSTPRSAGSPTARRSATSPPPSSSGSASSPPSTSCRSPRTSSGPPSRP
jgi:hypothetical protein